MHELTKVCEICQEIFTSSLPLFWIRACSQDIFKTIKGTNSCTEVAKLSSSDTSWRYSSDRKNRRNFNEPRYLIFLLQHLGVVINLEKSVLKPSQQIRVFRPKNRYLHHDFGTNRGKDRKGNFEMPESPFSPSNHCFGINKIHRSYVLNCPSSSA